MPQFGTAKSEPSALAQTHARLKAWWNGDAPPTQVQSGTDADDAVTVAPAPVDLLSIYQYASAALWGNGRTYPSNAEFEGALVAQSGGARASRIVVFSGDAGALARVASETTAAKIEIFEANPTRKAVVEQAVKASKQARRFGVHGFDWRPGSLPKSKADAAIFVFQGGHEGRLEAGAFCAERILRAGASAVWLDLFARHDDESLDDCRGFEARRFATEEEATIAFAACGLTMSGDDDCSAAYLGAFDVAWRDLAVNLGLRQAAMIKAGGYHASTAALEDIICWKARSEAIRTGKLMVKRYTLTS